MTSQTKDFRLLRVFKVFRVDQICWSKLPNNHCDSKPSHEHDTPEQAGAGVEGEVEGVRAAAVPGGEERGDMKTQSMGYWQGHVKIDRSCQAPDATGGWVLLAAYRAAGNQGREVIWAGARCWAVCHAWLGKMLGKVRWIMTLLKTFYGSWNTRRQQAITLASSSQIWVRDASLLFHDVFHVF